MPRMKSAAAAAVATVRIPGTTANLGSGFDTLGLAVALYNRATVQRRTDRRMDITSPIAEAARAGALAMLEEAAGAFFKKTRLARFGADIHLSGDVPIARGLGSSVTARLGCVAGLNALAGNPLDRQGLLEVVANLEGHPDNAAPAVYGGFTAAGFIGSEVRCIRVPLPSRVRLVTLIPDFEVSTPEARKRVPQTFSKADTIHILNRASLVTAAFTTGQLEALRGCFDDRIHQPHRAPLIPGMDAILAAGVKAGAVGGWLSGSGSTLMCLALENFEAVAAAMQRKMPQAAVHILKPDNAGLKVSLKAGAKKG
ncbi:MAG: putative homoserine kinase [Verrucomicrobiota bacterium]|jgi:homoserine kinase